MILRRLGILSLSLAMLAGCSTPAKREAHYISRGQALLERNRFAEARIEFLNAARVNPTDPAPIYFIGVTEEQRHNTVEAYKFFRAAADQDRHFVPAVLKLVQYLIAANALEEADRRLGTVLQDHPGNPDAHALKASILLNRTDFAGSEREARIALTVDSANLIAEAVLTGLYARQHRWDKVSAEFDHAEALHPQSVLLHALAVTTFRNTGDTADLERAYLSLLKLQPDNRDCRMELARFYDSHGRRQEAGAILRAGLALSPRDEELRRQLVDHADAEGGTPAALAEIDRAIQSDPANTDYLFWQADLFWSHGETEQATRSLVALYGRTGNADVKARTEVLLARIALAKGMTGAAETLVGRALADQPGNADALLVRAKITFEEGRWQRTVTDLRAVTEEHPDDSEALKLLAEAFLREGHLDLAADTLNDLLERDPANLPPLVRLAQTYHLMGASDHALEVLSAVTRLHPTDPIGWETTARIDEDLKDWAGAEDAIQTLSRLEGQGQLAQLLQAKLEFSQGKAAEALALLSETIKEDPRSGPAERAFNLMVAIEVAQGNCVNGTALLSSMPVETGRRANAIGQCQFILHQDDAAAGSFDVAIAARVMQPEAYLGRATLYLRASNPGAAVAVLKQGMTLLPTELSLPLMLSNVYLMSAQYAQAAQLYTDLLDRNPGLDLVANNLAALIADHEYQDTAALKTARSLAERFRVSDNPHLLDTLGWVCYRQGDFTDAISIFQRVERLGPVSPQTQYHFGLALLAAGRKTDAHARLQLAAEAADPFPDQDEAKRVLAGL